MRTLLVALFVPILMVGCDSTSSPTLSEAFCNDLEAGMSVVSIYGGVRENYDDPADFADSAYGMAAISCPNQLRSNTELRTFLEQWGIDPDA
jgi:hypothetical protein